MVIPFFLLLCLQQVGALYFQSYSGTIDGMACVDSTSETISFPSFTFSAPSTSELGTIGIRQIAFQRIQDGAYDNQGITVNGVNVSTIQTCCVATSCEAATQYAPWLEGECGLSWCGTENHWEYIDFTSSSLYSTGVPQGSSITITFTNPMAIVENVGSPIMAMSYDIIALSSSPSPTISLSPTSTQSVAPSSSESSTITSTASITPSSSPTRTPTSSRSPSSSPTQTPTSSITPSESITPTSTSSITPTKSITPTSTPSHSITPSESITPTSTSSITPTQSITPSESITPTSTSSITPTETITPSVTPSQSITPSISPSQSITPSITPTYSPTGSITPTYSPTGSITPTYSPTGSITPTISSSVSSSKTRSPPSSSSVSPSVSPSGICYSVSTLYGTMISLSSGWIIVNTGINVTQAYGGGYISMGNFQSCQMNALNKCVCSYTQGSTVAGCGGRRNSYITYSYGATTDITYTNESPTCSYNFLGTIGVPSSSPSITPSRTISPTSTPLIRPVLIADSAVDFPSVQGTNGWYYNYYDVTNVLHRMPYYGANMYRGVGPYWQIQNSSVCVISNAYAHPAHSSSCSTTVQGNCKPTITWNNTYPNNNTLYRVSYSASHPSIYPGTNGVKITLKCNDLVLRDASSPINIVQTNYSIYNLSSLELVLDPLNDCHSDGSTYNLKIYQYQPYPSTSPSLTPTLSPSVTSSPSQSLSESRSISKSSSDSVSISPSSTFSGSTTPTTSRTPTASITPSSSSSISATNSLTLTPSRTSTRTFTRTRTPAITVSPSISRTQFQSVSISSSGTMSDTNSPSFNSSATSTPLYYITYYPSSSATDRGTVTPTPLFMITPWPSNGTGTVSSTPLFMKIYYPSTTPVINYTYSYEPERVVTVVIAGIGVGIVSVAVIGVLAYYMLTKGTQIAMPKPPIQNNNRQQGGDDNTRIEISTADLREIEALLIEHKKQYTVL